LHDAQAPQLLLPVQSAVPGRDLRRQRPLGRTYCFFFPGGFAALGSARSVLEGRAAGLSPAYCWRCASVSTARSLRSNSSLRRAPASRSALASARAFLSAAASLFCCASRIVWRTRLTSWRSFF